LRGLKENVIIGRLIPAGTGFNTHQIKKDRQNSIKYGNFDTTNIAYSNSLASQTKMIQFDDLIEDNKNTKNCTINCYND